MSCPFQEWIDKLKKKEEKNYVLLREYEKGAAIPYQIFDKIEKNLKPEDGAEKCFVIDGEENGNVTYKPTDKVGVFPFKCDCEKIHMIIVAPKIARDEEPFKPLEAVSEMAAYSIMYNGSRGNGWYKIFTDAQHSWNGEVSGGEKIILFLLLSYIFSLEELVEKDFRKYYLPVEETLKCKVRGKIKISSYLNRWAVGKKIDIPCKWNLFTYDNWDNRILKSALIYAHRRLPKGALHTLTNSMLNAEGSIIKSHFYEVSDYEPWEIEFYKAKLRSVSPYYRNSLNIAELILKNTRSPSSYFSSLKPMYIDMDKLFEMFVSAVVKGSFGDAVKFQEGKRLFKSKEKNVFIFNLGEEKEGIGPSTIPDIVVKDKEGKEVSLVIDAKYKEILEMGEENPENVIDRINNGEELKIMNQDMYQLFFYMKSRNCSKGVIVFPFWEANGDEVYPSKIENPTEKESMSVKGPSVTFIGLNLAKNIGDVYKKGKEIIKNLI